jgi:hypothetical protein
LGIVPCVIRIAAIAIVNGVTTTAPTAGGILTLATLGWVRLISPMGRAHVLGEGLLTGDTRVVVGGVARVVHHGKNITHIGVIVKD